MRSNETPQQQTSSAQLFSPIAPVTLRLGNVRWIVRSQQSIASIESVLRDPDSWLARKDFQLRDTMLVTMGRIPQAGSNDSRDLLLRRTNYGKPISRLRDIFRVPAPIRAFRNSIAMEQANLPVPRAVAAGIVCVCGVPQKGYLLAEEISSALSLCEFLQQHGKIPSSMMKRVAEVVARMHELGFRHGDLTINNVLLDSQRSPWLIDIERGKRHSSALAWTEVVEEFYRFVRHVDKLGPAAQRASLQFLARYCQSRHWTGRERDLAKDVVQRLREKVGDEDVVARRPN